MPGVHKRMHNGPPTRCAFRRPVMRGVRYHTLIVPTLQRPSGGTLERQVTGSGSSTFCVDLILKRSNPHKTFKTRKLQKIGQHL